MHKRFLGIVAIAGSVAWFGASARAADEYKVDSAHSSVAFKISHLELSWIHGRFNDYSGAFTIDSDDAGKCAFEMSIKTDSVDTNNKNRDNHLRSPDFFNAKQFPAVTFKSTSVKQAKDGYEVTGEFTLHGVTKPVTVNLAGGKKAEFPKGTQRTGYTGDVTIKRSDFGIDKFAGAVGDDVLVTVSFEGVKK